MDEKASSTWRNASYLIDMARNRSPKQRDGRRLPRTGPLAEYSRFFKTLGLFVQKAFEPVFELSFTGWLCKRKETEKSAHLSQQPPRRSAVFILQTRSSTRTLPRQQASYSFGRALILLLLLLCSRSRRSVLWISCDLLWPCPRHDTISLRLVLKAPRALTTPHLLYLYRHSS